MKLRFALVSFVVFVLSSNAAPKTAFALVKEGDKFIPAQARDKINDIHSEKSGPSLMPDVWYITYSDSSAVMKATQVKFVNGEMAAVTQPKHILDVFNGGQRLDFKKLKVDSNKALGIATNAPMLTTVKLRAAQFWLSRTPTGSMWKIRLWAARQSNTADEVEIGDIYVSGKSGAILENKLKVSKAY